MSSISGIIVHFPYLGLALMVILGGVGFPLPEDTTLILCGFLISTRVIKPVYALSVVYSSLLMSDLILYSFGKKYGRKIVTHARFHKIISPERLSILENRFNKRGPLILLLGRHLVGLRAQLFIVAGIMRVPPLKFLALDAVSSLLTITIMVGAGYLAGNSLEVVRKDITRIGHIAILSATALLIIYLLVRYLRSISK
ncbi:MAG TPA: DedA family protein [Proteobacteria bacterium]|nr:DedA family protein [Pseudomonadota bacterium]